MINNCNHFIYIDKNNNNFLLLKCSYQDKEIAKNTLRDSTWDKELKMWRFSATHIKVNALKKVFPDLIITREAEEIVNKNKEINDNCLKIKQLKDAVLETPYIKTKLFSYQKVGVRFMLERDEAANFCELGTGKTLQTLTAVITRKELGQIKKCIVVCPASLKYNWQNEIDKHTFEKSIVIDGSKLKRIELYEEFKGKDDILFIIINYELLRIDVDIIRKHLNIDSIVLDECVKIKNPLAQQTKAVKQFSDKKYKYILSGYPIANNAIDTWSQIDFLKPGYIGSYWSFEDNYVIRGYFNQIEGYRNLEILKKKLDPLYIRFLKKDVLDLPEKIYQTREVTLEKDQLKAYEQMRDEMVVYLEKLNEKEIITQTRDILVKFIRLSQITSGFVSDVDMQNIHNFEVNAKLPVLEDIVEEVINNNKPIVIWCRFIPTAQILYSVLSKKYSVSVLTGSTNAKERQRIVDDFQNGKTQIFIGQILAGGMGINLFKADTEIFFEKAFLSPSSIIQAEDRLHRIGQQNKVTIISLIAKNTIDERWEKMMAKKRDIAEQILGDKAFRINKQIVMEFLQDV